MTDLSNLINLINVALAGADSPEGEVTAIEAYSLAFDEWFTQHSEELQRMSAGEEVPGLDRPRVVELLEKHEQLLTQAEALQSNTSFEIRQLKARGKGILAYTDTLPKSISIRRPRKG